ncbi:MAG: cytochrome C oxidase subunit IV family protein [Pirellulales bacterium]|nr:cytochrome C oxidase subunit IV family protein [Pirellulales bacterium]
MSAHAHQQHDATGHHDEAGSVKLYVTIFVALLVLTAATVAASNVPLGRWHIPVAISIAVIKALLVLLFFMHLLGGSRLQWLVVAAAGCFATIFVSLIGADYASRDWYLPPPAPLEQQIWQPAEIPPSAPADKP